MFGTRQDDYDDQARARDDVAPEPVMAAALRAAGLPEAVNHIFEALDDLRDQIQTLGDELASL